MFCFYWLCWLSFDPHPTNVSNAVKSYYWSIYLYKHRSLYPKSQAAARWKLLFYK